uniref:Uncharacterized protein n=1 Tax=Glossina palpalis gambiensis TaxID=67801 RepID=A0A1B0BZP6_9MUSC
MILSVKEKVKEKPSLRVATMAPTKIATDLQSDEVLKLSADHLALKRNVLVVQPNRHTRCGLTGCDWLSILKLNWNEIFKDYNTLHVAISTNIQGQLSRLTAKHKNVFEKSDDKMKNKQDINKARSNSTLLFLKPQQMPFTPKSAVKCEINGFASYLVLIPFNLRLTCVRCYGTGVVLSHIIYDKVVGSGKTQLSKA